MARKSRRTRRLRVVNPDCAGTDIGKGRHFVVRRAQSQTTASPLPHGPLPRRPRVRTASDL